MSTPSSEPLDNFDPVSPYAPKWARDQNLDVPAEPQRPAGIETDHDARILDEIEASLRAMIESSHGSDEPTRLSDVSRAAAEELAAQREEQQAAVGIGEPPAATAAPATEPQPERPDAGRLATDMATVREAFRDPRTPPWLLSRSLDPEPVPEPVDEHWPQPRKRRRRSNSLFLRFGLAATGAAIVAAIAIKDIQSYVMDLVRGPIADLSTNAAAVFNEGKASSLQVRMDTVRKEQDRASEPGLRYAVASVDPQARPVAVRTESIGRAPEPRRETVMTPWPSPEAVKRSDPPGWQSSAPAQAMQTPATQPPGAQTTAVQSPAEKVQTPSAASDNAAPSSHLSSEEIAMLRKMGDDYISSGDFVGARAVLERAAEAGDASAAFAIASTYDPVVLERFKVRGLEPDIVRAEFWYERAKALGSPEAPHRLRAMMAARTH
jgi:hypothetical protein